MIETVRGIAAHSQLAGHRGWVWEGDVPKAEVWYFSSVISILYLFKCFPACITSLEFLIESLFKLTQMYVQKIVAKIQSVYNYIRVILLLTEANLSITLS